MAKSVVDDSRADGGGAAGSTPPRGSASHPRLNSGVRSLWSSPIGPMVTQIRVEACARRLCSGPQLRGNIDLSIHGLRVRALWPLRASLPVDRWVRAHVTSAALRSPKISFSLYQGSCPVTLGPHSPSFLSSGRRGGGGGCIGKSTHLVSPHVESWLRIWSCKYVWTALAVASLNVWQAAEYFIWVCDIICNYVITAWECFPKMTSQNFYCSHQTAINFSWILPVLLEPLWAKLPMGSGIIRRFPHGVNRAKVILYEHCFVMHACFLPCHSTCQKWCYRCHSDDRCTSWKHFQGRPCSCSFFHSLTGDITKSVNLEEP